jgi:hypothetical protein
MNKQQLELHNGYKSVEARMVVDYVIGICEKCFKKGLFNEEFPIKELEEITKQLADNVEFLSNEYKSNEKTKI